MLNTILEEIEVNMTPSANYATLCANSNIVTGNNLVLEIPFSVSDVEDGLTVGECLAKTQRELDYLIVNDTVDLKWNKIPTGVPLIITKYYSYGVKSIEEVTSDLGDVLPKSEKPYLILHCVKRLDGSRVIEVDVVK